MERLQRNFNMDFTFPSDKEITVLEYIWVGGRGIDIRGKTMMVDKIVNKLEDFPSWHFDGSSTFQADGGANSEVVIKPRFFCKDPFRAKDYPHSYIVLCDTYQTDKKTPLKTNFRHYAAKIFEECGDENPTFGFEQEYILVNPKGTLNNEPLAFPNSGFPKAQGQYYCSVGATNAFGRIIPEAHLKACNYAGLKIGGVNGEVFPGQWEFQIGPCPGAEVGDQMWVARYILNRIAEDYGCDITYHPKPIRGDWNGSGCHCNFSTKKTMEKGEKGYEEMERHMKLLEKYKDRVITYGVDNELRMTGSNETSSLKEFTWGVGDRSASVRIPGASGKETNGYYEDRRPSGNCDPWLVSAIVADSTLLDGKYGEEMVKAYNWACENVDQYGHDCY